MDSTPSDPAGPRPAPRRRLLHLVRRVHLYSGLFLMPWVLMYAVTGILFNHPTLFPDQPGAAWDRQAAAGTPLEDLRRPADVAADVVAELNRRAGTDRYRLVRPESAKFRGDYVSAVHRSPKGTNQVFVDLRDGSGFARRRIDPPADSVPFTAARDFPAGESVAGQLDRGLPTALARAQLPVGTVTVTHVPDVVFDLADADGREWRAAYNPLHGSLGGVPAEYTEKPATRRFLTRLHVTRGYPPGHGSGWFWALAVDVVCGAMLFWALSGLVMWWQLRAIRWAGLSVLLASTVAAAWLAVAMHSQLAP